MTEAPLHASVSLCAHCMAQIPCTYEARGDEVWQVKHCDAHGTQESVVWHGVEHWHWTRSFETAPACAPDSGCCSEEGAADRRRCLAVIEVTENCNLACSYCFASSKPGLPDRSREAIRADLETVRSNGITPIQLSGGEPTTRTDLVEIVGEARALGFTHIEVNTNGIQLAEDTQLARRLKEAGTTAIYLQFDGFGEALYNALRGRKDMEQLKRRAIENCREAKLSVILVPTIVAGKNEDQLGDIVQFALDNLDVVRGVNVQPVSHFGRSQEDTGHLSLPRIASLLEAQTSFLRQKDLLQVPCCGPQCSSATMLLKAPGKVVPLTRLVTEEAYRDIVAAFDSPRFMDLLSGRAEGISAAKDAAACCGIPVPPGLERFTPRMLALTITGFMDADNVDVQRLGKCCINVPLDGRMVPFCGYNLTTRSGGYALRDRYRTRKQELPVRP